MHVRRRASILYMEENYMIDNNHCRAFQLIITDFIVCENEMGCVISNIGGARFDLKATLIRTNAYSYIISHKLAQLRCLRYFHKNLLQTRAEDDSCTMNFLLHHTQVCKMWLCCVCERDDKITRECIYSVYVNLASICAHKPEKEQEIACVESTQ